MTLARSIKYKAQSLDFFSAKMADIEFVSLTKSASTI